MYWLRIRSSGVGGALTAHWEKKEGKTLRRGEKKEACFLETVVSYLFMCTNQQMGTNFHFCRRENKSNGSSLTYLIY